MKLKPLILCHLIAAFLIATFLWAPARACWDIFDTALFKFLNGTLESNRPWQFFWALANHKMTDWVEDVVFITFFILAVRMAPKSERIRRSAQFIFAIVFAAFVLYGVNRVIFREAIHIPRESPSLVIQPCVRLSDEIYWLKIKDDATASFPGDHATTLLLFAGSYWFFAGRKLGIYALLYTLFRMLPRLFAGAHWFSDIAVGSGSIALIALSWALFTPLHSQITDSLVRLLRLFSFKRAYE